MSGLRALEQQYVDIRTTVLPALWIFVPKLAPSV